MDREPTADGNLTMLEVLAAYAADGYVQDMFVTPDAMVRCGVCHHDALPSDLVLHGLRRIEGASDPGDMAAVLALSCNACGAKGTLVVRFGPEAEPQDDAVLLAIDDQRFSDG